MRILVNYFLVMLMAIHLFSCTSGQKRNKETLKIEWRPGINAPRYYPIRSIGGSFTNGENICPITYGVNQYDGWGQGGQEMTTGDFIPDTLYITWFSYAEDKFFRGTFPLPYDTMYTLFKQGCINGSGVHVNYNGLIVNVYPEGGVALWMDGAGRQVELGHF